MDERIRDTILTPMQMVSDVLIHEIGVLNVQLKEKQNELKKIKKAIQLIDGDVPDSMATTKPKKERVRRISPHLVERVYNALANSEEPMTRQEIKEATGSAIETVGSAITLLRDEGRVRHAGTRNTNGPYKNPEVFTVMNDAS